MYLVYNFVCKYVMSKFSRHNISFISHFAVYIYIGHVTKFCNNEIIRRAYEFTCTYVKGRAIHVHIFSLYIVSINVHV